MHPPSVEHQEALTEYPWDNKDSLDGLDKASIGHFAENDNNPSGAPNNQAGTYSESTNNTALKLGGICFTTKQHYETELLKILSDVNALHYPIVNRSSYEKYSPLGTRGIASQF
jgi:hypothetical protein